MAIGDALAGHVTDGIETMRAIRDSADISALVNNLSRGASWLTLFPTRRAHAAADRLPA